MAVCQNLVPLVNIKIAGKWMFIPLKMVLIGIDPYLYIYILHWLNTPCPPNSQNPASLHTRLSTIYYHGNNGIIMHSSCSDYSTAMPYWETVPFCNILLWSIPICTNPAGLLPSPAICLLERLRQKWRVPLARRLGDVKTCNMEFLPAPRDASSLRVGPKWIWSPGNIYGVISLVRGAKMC